MLLYDPRTNISTTTTYDELVEITGKSKQNLASLKSRKMKINNINCYIIDDKTTVNQRKQMYTKEQYHNEIWRPIHGSNNKYLISTYGRFQRVLKNGDTSFILPVLKKRSGYLEVKVPYGGSYKSYAVGNLVALHFIGKPKDGEVLRHKNGIKTDSVYTNLEYQNKSQVAKKTGPLSRSKPVVQLDRVTREIIGEFRSAREAGRNCYLSYQAVLDNCNRKSKTSGGYIFMFVSDYEEAFPDMPYIENPTG